MKKIKFNCKKCNKYIEDYKQNRTKYCSRECCYSDRKGKNNHNYKGIFSKNCLNCNKKFSGVKCVIDNKKFCSLNCSSKYNYINNEKVGLRKGHKTWNTGLTKETDERVRKYATTRLGTEPWNKTLTKFIDKRVKKNADSIRKSMIEYVKKVGGPLFGKNEKEILDKLAKDIGYKIIRQYFVNGYFIDGYIPELNLAIEVDEEHHSKQTKKDIIRQKEIEKELDCKFLRIKDI